MIDTKPFPSASKAGQVRVSAVQTGRVRVKKAQVQPTRHGLARIAGPIIENAWADWLPTFVWVVDHPEGVIVVDTGSATHLKALPQWHPYFRRAVQFDIEPEQEIGPQLRAMGLRQRDIWKVVLTHMHIDHDAGLHHFVGSHVLAEQREIALASGLRGRLMGYLPRRWPDGFDPAPFSWDNGPIGPFEKSTAITRAGDVFVIPTPGHTDNHVSVVVMHGDMAIMLAGDATYKEAMLIAGQIDGVGWSEALQKDTLARIRSFASSVPTVLLPTHDPESAGRLAHLQTVPRR